MAGTGLSRVAWEGVLRVLRRVMGQSLVHSRGGEEAGVAGGQSEGERGEEVGARSGQACQL